MGHRHEEVEPEEKIEPGPNPAQSLANKFLDDSIFSRFDQGTTRDGFISADEIKSLLASKDEGDRAFIKETFGDPSKLKVLADHMDSLKTMSFDWTIWSNPGASKSDFQVLAERSAAMKAEMDLAAKIAPTIKDNYRSITGYSSELEESRLRSASYNDRAYTAEERAVFKFILDNKHQIMESSRTGLRTDYVLKGRDYLGNEPSRKLGWFMERLDQKYELVKALNDGPTK